MEKDEVEKLTRSVSRSILLEDDPTNIRNFLLCLFYAVEEIATTDNVGGWCAKERAIEALEAIEHIQKHGGR